MGTVAITSHQEPARSYGGTTAETMERINYTRQQEIQCLKDDYETQIRTLQVTHRKEKRDMKLENQKLKNDIRVHKIINTKLRKNYATMMNAEADLQSELQQVKLNLKKGQEDNDIEIIEMTHRREKRKLIEQIREQRDFVRSLKIKNKNMKKDREESKKSQNNLQEEVQMLSDMNNKLQKKYGRAMGTEDNLRTELERVKAANGNMKKYRQSKMKDCEKDKEVLVVRNQELQKELEAIKKLGIDKANEGKVSLDNFKFIRRLGEGAFGTVFLAKGNLPGRPEQHYAIKTL
jgi:hypothetical protein